MLRLMLRGCFSAGGASSDGLDIVSFIRQFQKRLYLAVDNCDDGDTFDTAVRASIERAISLHVILSAKRTRSRLPVSCTQPCGIFNSRDSDSATAVHKVFGLVRQPTRDFAARPEFHPIRALFVQYASESLQPGLHALLTLIAGIIILLLYYYFGISGHSKLPGLCYCRGISVPRRQTQLAL